MPENDQKVENGQKVEKGQKVKKFYPNFLPNLILYYSHNFKPIANNDQKVKKCQFCSKMSEYVSFCPKKSENFQNFH